MTFHAEASPLLLSGVKPVGFGKGVPQETTDILIGADGNIAGVGASLAAPEGARRIDAKGAYISPGWVDLHAHVWHGGTDISIKPQVCGIERGVTTIVDAGSAGEANFHGFREYVIEPASGAPSTVRTALSRQAARTGTQASTSRLPWKIRNGLASSRARAARASASSKSAAIGEPCEGTFARNASARTSGIGRTRTLNSAVIILDEGQNTTIPQMKMFLTRMGNGSKIIVTGDVTQVDLPRQMRSGLQDAIHRLRDVDRIATIYLGEEDIVRHPLVQQIVRAYENEKPKKRS